MKIIIDPQNSDTCKIQLTIEINCISLKDVEKECAIHSRSEKIKFTPYNDAHENFSEFWFVQDIL